MCQGEDEMQQPDMGEHHSIVVKVLPSENHQQQVCLGYGIVSAACPACTHTLLLLQLLWVPQLVRPERR